MIRFSPATQSATVRPIAAPVAAVSAVAAVLSIEPSNPAPALELVSEPEVASRTKSTKSRAAKRKIANPDIAAPQLEL